MTNYENIVTMKPDELANFLCEMLDNACINPNLINTNLIACDICPAKDKCYLKHNGFIDWLNEETE